MINVDKNPKLEGSNLIDCIPQTGFCPNFCTECYFNNGFFRTLDEPLVPTLEEVGDKIVRVNSGNDSNVRKDSVLETTKTYPKKFYNTSIPSFDFPAPVVFTCNGKELHKVLDENIMFVRFRVNTWNLIDCDEAIDFYTSKAIPVVLTFMRYRLVENIERIEDYEIRKSILNTYWCIKPHRYEEVVLRYHSNKLVYTCGSLASSYCRDCGNCEHLWYKWNGRRNK